MISYFLFLALECWIFMFVFFSWWQVFLMKGSVCCHWWHELPQCLLFVIWADCGAPETNVISVSIHEKVHQISAARRLFPASLSEPLCPLSRSSWLVWRESSVFCYFWKLCPSLSSDFFFCWLVLVFGLWFICFEYWHLVPFQGVFQDFVCLIFLMSFPPTVRNLFGS